MVGSGGGEMAQQASGWLQGVVGCQLRTIVEKKNSLRDMTHRMMGNRNQGDVHG